VAVGAVALGYCAAGEFEVAGFDSVAGEFASEAAFVEGFGFEVGPG